MSDGSISCQKKVGGRRVPADKRYSVELVSPILTYAEDIETIQGLVRGLRKAGCFTSENCGIHYLKLEIMQSWGFKAGKISVDMLKHFA